MPMGMTNASAASQTLMISIANDGLRIYELVYVDEVIYIPWRYKNAVII